MGEFKYVQFYSFCFKIQSGEKDFQRGSSLHANFKIQVVLPNFKTIFETKNYFQKFFMKNCAFEE